MYFFIAVFKPNTFLARTSKIIEIFFIDIRSLLKLCVKSNHTQHGWFGTKGAYVIWYKRCLCDS